jgi:ribonuclease M5
LIKRASINNNIILFLDPDGPGEKIRKILQNELESFQQAFIKKTDIKNSKKIGIAEATDESIVKAFENLKYFNSKINTLS